MSRAAEMPPPDVEVITPEGNPFQLAYLASSCDWVIGGGGAGAGKSYALLLDPLRHIHVPGYGALILRQDEKDLEKPDSPWKKSQQLYPKFGGDPLIAERLWRFPSGAEIRFGHVGRYYEKDYQGSAFCGLYLDELTHYTQSAVRYLLARNRSTCGVKAYMRATCNPDRDSWVKGLVMPWLLPVDAAGRQLADQAQSGRPRFVLGRLGEWDWGETRAELLQRHPRARPAHIKSVTFIPGRLADNKYLGEDYEGSLLLQDEAIVRAWLEGDWNAGADESTERFEEAWFKEVDSAPVGTRWIRVWDLAATAENVADHGHSYSSGLLIGLGPDGAVYIGNLVVGRWDEADVERRVLMTAGVMPMTGLVRTRAPRSADVPAEPDGEGMPIWFCSERAGAGKSQLGHYIRLLHGREVDGEPETGKKIVRQAPLRGQARVGNVYMVRGAWNAAFLWHIARPDRPDDVKDCAAAGYERLTQGPRAITGAELSAVVAANPGLQGGDQGGGRHGAAPRGGLGGGRFRL